MVSYLANKVLANEVSEESRSKLYDAFLAASYAGHSRVVQSMLDLTSFWNVIGETNKTTILTRGLVVATEYGRRKTSNLLLKNGAEIHVCVQEVPNPRRSDRKMASLAAFFEDRLPLVWEHAYRRQQPENSQVSESPTPRTLSSQTVCSPPLTKIVPTTSLFCSKMVPTRIEFVHSNPIIHGLDISHKQGQWSNRHHWRQLAEVRMIA